MRFLFIFIFLFISAVFPSHGQAEREDRLGIGVGPGLMYGDNTCQCKFLMFKVLPAVSVDYHKKINLNFDVRGTVGWQMLNSGDFLEDSRKLDLARVDLPHAFRGNFFYADVMPLYYLNPDQSGYLPSLIKIYGGLGLGFFHSGRTDEKFVLNDIDGPTVTYKASNSGIFFPARLGIFRNLDSGGEIGLEGSLLISPFTEIEGNDLKTKIFKPDTLVQFQFFYRITLGSSD
jgi:hypothetical protein